MAFRLEGGFSVVQVDALCNLTVQIEKTLRVLCVPVVLFACYQFKYELLAVRNCRRVDFRLEPEMTVFPLNPVKSAERLPRSVSRRALFRVFIVTGIEEKSVDFPDTGTCKGMQIIAGDPDFVFHKLVHVAISLF